MAVRYSTFQTIEKFKQIHGDRFSYEKWEYGGDKRSPGIIICKEHGEFITCRMDHERQKNGGCPKCSNVPIGGWKNKDKEMLLKSLKELHPILDFAKYNYVNGTTKVILKCPIHGEFEKTPKHLLRGQGCPICSGKKKKSLIIIQNEINSIHNGKYTLNEDSHYINNKTPIEISCDIHGSWMVRPDNLINSKTRCPKCAGSFSKSEINLFEFVKTLDSSSIQGDRKIIKPLQLDVYCPNHNLAIEYNGLYHHSEIDGKKPKTYHINKTLKCLERNIKLLHIFEDEWLDPIKNNIWKSMITHRIGMTPNKYYARKCNIKTVSRSEASSFLSTNHLQGYRNCSIHLGLYYMNELVGILSMGKSRYDKKIEWEIIRYSVKCYSNVIGGFQKLLQYFINHYSPSSIVTYADRRYSEGDMYRNAGMVEEPNTSLNYYYFKKRSPSRLSRHQCQKHKLEFFLPVFDPLLSERDNMINNGYDIIWDCGNKKFVSYF